MMSSSDRREAGRFSESEERREGCMSILCGIGTGILKRSLASIASHTCHPERKPRDLLFLAMMRVRTTERKKTPSGRLVENGGNKTG
jgi:hypothetical protein